MIEETIIEQRNKRPRGPPRKEKPAESVVKRPRVRPQVENQPKEKMPNKNSEYPGYANR